jgi:alanine-glyoxylate transaminase/serine-glyoxylate transaminase/serine-pyruvate transaminase
MGPGPSNINLRVAQALSAPLIGHLDPCFLEVMDEVVRVLRRVFQTRNRLTIPISGTGSAGMEAALVNFLAPGDKAIIGINGLFGERMADICQRLGADVIALEADWGRIVEPDRLISALKSHPEARLLAVVHAETSTGAWQPLAELGEACARRETLFLVDAVTSLAGCPVKVDEWQIDICYSATQKCLSVPPGLAPLTVSDKAARVSAERSSKVSSWYLDLGLIMKYWGKERVYHHSAPVSMIYALHEGLRLVLEEGLEERFARHRRVARLLEEKLNSLGFAYFAQEGYRLPMLNAVRPARDMDIHLARQRLLSEYNIEVGGGLGPLKDQIWRVGLMGESAREENVDRLIRALAQIRRG